MTIEANRLTFYLGSLAVPALLVLLNFLVRKAKHWYYTAGSDFLLMLMTFSFSSAAMAHDIAPYMRDADLRDAAPAIFLVLGILILICWYWTVTLVESSINESIREESTLSLGSQAKILTAWALVVGYSWLEFMLFLYR